MNCESCKQLISAFLDNDLDIESSADVRGHLAVCADCTRMCEDFAMILDFCDEDQFEARLEPNSEALWCRINNVIETEIQPELDIAGVSVNEDRHAAQTGWFSRLWNNSLQMTFSQGVTAVIGIALVSSLLTVIGVKNFAQPEEGLTAKATTVSETIFEKVLGKFGLIETPQQARDRKLAEQQKTIDYWNKRAEARRENWNPELRDAFDRNLKEIDQVVSEYRRILEKNPLDALTGEMLDSAMKEKMDFLREFSEL